MAEIRKVDYDWRDYEAFVKLKNNQHRLSMYKMELHLHRITFGMFNLFLRQGIDSLCQFYFVSPRRNGSPI